MTDQDLLTLCAYKEANAEVDDGVAAIVYVVLERMRLKFQSDGTIPGTVLKHNQFSWVEWDMVDGRYTRVATTPDQIRDRTESLLTEAKGHYPKAWARCSDIVEQVQEGVYSGPLFANLEPGTVNYLNPAISHTAWATPDKLVCVIGHHNFYKA